VGVTATARLAPPRGVDLWSLPLAALRPHASRLAAACSEREWARDARVRVAARRGEFLLARGCTRTILATYLDGDPAALPFATGEHGKPYLDLPGAPAFSVSHSHGRLVIAVAAGFAVGVDIERIDPGADVAAIARRFMSVGDATQILGLAPGARAQAFFRWWTRREAELKARGCGLAGCLRETFAPEPLASTTALRADSRWPGDFDGTRTLVELALVPGYATALSYAAPPVPLIARDRALARL
jgi:4'-phosphopantetheinyl transferase